MGMSASQARLLTLTARLSDLELQAQQISNAKIRLSQKTEEAATTYNNALTKETLQVYKTTDTDSQDATYIDATARNLTTYGAVSTTDKQRFLEDTAGRIIVSKEEENAYVASGGSVEKFLNALGYSSITASSSTATSTTTVTTTTNASGATITNVDVTSTNNAGTTTSKDYTYDSGAVTFYTNVFNKMQNGYNAQDSDNMNSTDWLYAQLSSGNLTLVEQSTTDADGDGENDWTEVSWSSGDSSLKQETDDEAIARAEAKYDVEMASIQSKDKVFDLQLQQINTEHTAVQTEFDTTKKVIEKNIERSFKIFNA